MGYQVLTEVVFAFGILAVSVVLHSSGLMVLFEWLSARRSSIERGTGMVNYTLLLIFTFSIISAFTSFRDMRVGCFLLLAGTLFGFRDCSLFSLGTTDERLRRCFVATSLALLGGIEEISGVLLSGLSTAFVFALVNAMFQARLRSRA